MKLINASAVYAISAGTLVRATADQLSTLTDSAFKLLFSHFTGPVNTSSGFPVHLYYRFSFCLAACYISKTGTGVSSIGVFGGGTDNINGRAPRARPTARVAPANDGLAADDIPRQSAEPYPNPSLETTLALLQSSPNCEDLKPSLLIQALAKHAVARLAIIQSFEMLSTCQNDSPWSFDNNIPNWRMGIAKGMQSGFKADTRAGMESLDDSLWAQTRNMCQIMCEDWL